jgi:hypothetical protein
MLRLAADDVLTAGDLGDLGVGRLDMLLVLSSSQHFGRSAQRNIEAAYRGAWLECRLGADLLSPLAARLALPPSVAS